MSVSSVWRQYKGRLLNCYGDKRLRQALCSTCTIALRLCNKALAHLAVPEVGAASVGNQAALVFAAQHKQLA